MSRICYTSTNIGADRLELIRVCNLIITEYQSDGYVLTLRQLYYQLVSRDVIPNTMKSYKRVGDVVNDARMAGLMDWDAIEDRTRELVRVSSWDSPAEILETCARQFRLDLWEKQDNYVEVWIEKEALASVFERACKPLGVPHFCCRGYTSQSEMWGAGQRFARAINSGKEVHVLHFGDHDPSGIDMTRDIDDRLQLFVGKHAKSSRFHIDRLALNMDQVETYSPPENPAKITDSRFASYEAKFGDKSWELDALNPRVLNAMVKEHVLALADEDLFAETRGLQANCRGLLQTLADNWDDVSEHIGDTYTDELTENKEQAQRDADDE